MSRALPTRLFRVLLPCKDLARSRQFYETLLATSGRLVAPGRIYFDCGPVLLGILDYSRIGNGGNPPAEALYFATNDLEGIHRRAESLGCLTNGLLHDDPSSPLGQIVVRPWGERSFYADDPSGNPLCFVEAGTEFTGTREQVASLEAMPPNRGHSQSPSTRSRSRPGPRKKTASR